MFLNPPIPPHTFVLYLLANGRIKILEEFIDLNHSFVQYIIMVNAMDHEIYKK
jgi:hypothetical protein